MGQGRSGIAISGDVSLNEVTDNVKASINTAGTVTASYQGTTAPPQTYAIDARNTTNFIAASGSMAISMNTDSSAAFQDLRTVYQCSGFHIAAHAATVALAASLHGPTAPRGPTQRST